MKLWERLAKWSRQLVAAAVAPHGVPRHVAFIMDGNRRFAERQHLRRIDGHAAGYQRLLAALEWCLELGVECVSVYAFSIDNYKRSSAEVELLMGLAELKLGTMLEEQDVLVRHGVQVRVIGDLSLAPPRVQQAAAKVMAATQRHTKAVLNICFSYTASQEMLQALDRASLASTCACDGPCLAPSSNSSSSGNAASHLDPFLLTQGCPPVDLLIRTSGETRLSDFLLWQSRHALLVFTPVLWPDFGFLDLLSALVEYQRCKPALDRACSAAELAVQRAGAGAGGRSSSSAACMPSSSSSSSSKVLDDRQQLMQTGPESRPYQEWEQDFAACRPAEQTPGLQQLCALSVLADGSFKNVRPFENSFRPYRQHEPHVRGDIQPLGAGAGSDLAYTAGASAAAAAAAAAAALDYRGPADSLLGSSSDGIAVVKVLHLGAESPWGGSSRSPSPIGVASPAGVASSPSGAASPQKVPTPKWEGSPTRLLQVRTPSCGSLMGSSPNGKCLGSVRSGGLGGFRSAGSLRLGGSVDSFTSIELGEQQRRMSSYQDLLGLDS